MRHAEYLKKTISYKLYCALHTYNDDWIMSERELLAACVSRVGHFKCRGKDPGSTTRGKGVDPRLLHVLCQLSYLFILRFFSPEHGAR